MNGEQQSQAKLNAWHDLIQAGAEGGAKPRGARSLELSTTNRAEA